MRVVLLDGVDLARPISALARMRKIGCTHLGTEASQKVLEDELQQAVKHLKDLVVVAVDRHLQIQARELGEMPVRVRVLRTEGRPDLGYTLYVHYDDRPLREMGALRKACKAGEAIGFEGSGGKRGW